MYIPIILGTAREGRQAEKAANFMLEQAKTQTIESEILDVRDYRIGATDNTEAGDIAKKYAEKIKKADALTIVTPEYNHGYPGELKMMLDLLYKEYFYKPVGFCGVSISEIGGARAVEQLRLVAIELHMIPSREALYFSKVAELFDASGKIKDESYFQKTKLFFDELIKLAKK